ncbi:MAG: hypothetical protein KME29_14935 [Calothrix sp. FI2-JRJ7]|jgi:hypothetical protein|nr:hypothetical protein [Calothrix sp. FI2-JRJ7]
MFDPISLLIGGAIAATAIFTIVYYAYLTWSIIVDWFQDYEHLAVQPNNVAATIKTRLDSGEHAVVQGIFDRRTSEEIEARTITYDQLDSQIQNAHRNSEVVIWE